MKIQISTSGLLSRIDDALDGNLEEDAAATSHSAAGKGRGGFVPPPPEPRGGKAKGSGVSRAVPNSKGKSRGSFDAPPEPRGGKAKGKGGQRTVVPNSKGKGGMRQFLAALDTPEPRGKGKGGKSKGPKYPEWLEAMSEEHRAAYFEDHPNSKYRS